MTKEVSKQIMKRFKSKNLYFKWSFRENFLVYKNENKNKNKNKNKCKNMTKYAKKGYFRM